MVKFNASIVIGFTLLVFGTLFLALYLIKKVTMKSNNAFIMFHLVMYVLVYSTAIAQQFYFYKITIATTC